MVWWVLSHVELKTNSVLNDGGVVISSLHSKAFRNMYKFRKPKVFLNKQFLDEFQTERPNLAKVV